MCKIYRQSVSKSEDHERSRAVFTNLKRHSMITEYDCPADVASAAHSVKIPRASEINVYLTWLRALTAALVKRSYQISIDHSSIRDL